MIQLPLVVFALGIAIGGASAWTIESWRHGKKIAEIQLQQSEIEKNNLREVRVQESKRYKELQDAQIAAQKRNELLKQDSRRTALELGRLRDTINKDRDDSTSESPGACTERRIALGELLVTCSERHTELAATADGHVNDIKTLIESWPK